MAQMVRPEQRQGVVGLEEAQVDTLGNVGTDPTNANSRTVKAFTLAKAGDALRIRAWGTTSADGDDKEAILKLGGSALITTGVLAANAKPWFLEAIVVQHSHAVQRGYAWGSANGAILAPVLIALTLDERTNLEALVVLEAETSANQVTCEGMLIEALVQ